MVRSVRVPARGGDTLSYPLFQPGHIGLTFYQRGHRRVFRQNLPAPRVEHDRTVVQGVEHHRDSQPGVTKTGEGAHACSEGG